MWRCTFATKPHTKRGNVYAASKVFVSIMLAKVIYNIDLIILCTSHMTVIVIEFSEYHRNTHLEATKLLH